MKQVRIRASSFWDWCDCPLRAACRNPDIGGMQDRPATAASWLGTSIHHASAEYDRASHIEKDPIRVSDAVDIFVEKMRNPDEEVNWDGESRNKIEATGGRLLAIYADDISPQFDFREVEKTLDSFTVDFSADDINHPTEGISLTITGTQDRLYRDVAGRVAPADIKTGAQAVNPDGAAKVQGFEAQLGLYQLLTEATTGEPCEADPAILGLKTSKKPETGIAFIPNAKEILLGKGDEPGQLLNLAKLIGHGIFMGNTKSMMCHEKYCPNYDKCSYRARDK